MDVTVNVPSYNQMRAEPHSEQENVTEKDTDSFTSEEPKTPSNPTLQADGEREREGEMERGVQNR